MDLLDRLVDEYTTECLNTFQGKLLGLFIKEGNYDMLGTCYIPNTTLKVRVQLVDVTLVRGNENEVLLTLTTPPFSFTGITNDGGRLKEVRLDVKWLGQGKLGTENMFMEKPPRVVDANGDIYVGMDVLHGSSSFYIGHVPVLSIH